MSDVPLSITTRRIIRLTSLTGKMFAAALRKRRKKIARAASELT
jgi:hypothetical protein